MKNTTDSILTQKRLKLVPSQYFDRLIARMKKSGYELFSQVVIDTNDCNYHVDVEYAKQTALFFHLPNKKLIIHFVFHEYENPGRHEATQYWRIHFYPVFKSMQRLIEMTHVPFDQRDEFENSNPLLETMPLRSVNLKIPGFRYYGGHQYEQENTHIEPIDSESLGTTIVRRLYPTLQYIGYGQFKHLQVTDFWPHYTFHGSHKIFWDRFNNEAFKKIVKRPWGGEDNSHRY